MMAATAHGEQGCNTNFVIVSITALGEGGGPVSAPLVEGQKIVYRAGLIVPKSSPPIVYCCVIGGVLTIETPDGGVVDAEVPLTCPKMPFFLNAPYTVGSGDAQACLLSAHTSYANGVYLSNPKSGGAGGSASLSLALDGCCLGDVTGDLNVDVADLVAVILAWGSCGQSCPADANGDDIVDQDDLVEVVLNWGACE